MPWLLANRRRRRLRAEGLPPAWRSILEERWPLYGRLDEARRREVDGHARVLLEEKYFEGCGGLELTDEHRVLIAGQAALLQVGREADYFPGLRSILVYPDVFVGRGRSSGPGGMVTESRGPRSGESWHTPGVGGPVVLAWRDVRSGAADADDGRNVVLHEFAHQLDGESEVMEGIPRLASAEEVKRWQSTLHAELTRFVMLLRAGQPVAINPYGAQSPAEFYACATEAFFETPRALAERHPRVFELLRGFHGVDPSAWAAAPSVGEAEAWCCA